MTTATLPAFHGLCQNADCGQHVGGHDVAPTLFYDRDLLTPVWLCGDCTAWVLAHARDRYRPAT